MLRPCRPQWCPVRAFLRLEDEIKFCDLFSCSCRSFHTSTRAQYRLCALTRETFRLSRGHIDLRIILPAASPQIMTGLRFSLPVMLILVVI